MFGLFGSLTSTAQVSVNIINVPAPAGGGGGHTATCAVGYAPGANKLTFYNTGSANTSTTQVSLTYGGSAQTAAVVAGCNVMSGAYATITLAGYTVAGTSDAPFTGSASLTNGGQVAFSGHFQ